MDVTLKIVQQRETTENGNRQARARSNVVRQTNKNKEAQTRRM